jgi:hypothetical protein
MLGHDSNNVNRQGKYGSPIRKTERAGMPLSWGIPAYSAKCVPSNLKESGVRQGLGGGVVALVWAHFTV